MTLKRIGIAALLLSLAMMAPLRSAAQENEQTAADIRFHLAKLEAQNPMTRARAADALWQFAEQEVNWLEIRKALPKLTALLEDPLPVVRARAAILLLRIAEPEDKGADTRKTAYETLEKDAADSRTHVRLGVIEAAELIGPDERLNELIQKLTEDEDIDVQETAQHLLNRWRRPPRGQGGAPFDVGPLIDFNPFGPPEGDGAAQEGSPAELAQARDAAGRVPDPSALETLARLTRYRSGFRTQGGGLVSLEEAVDPAVQPLIEFIRAEKPARPLELRYAAIALGCADEEALPLLAASLEYAQPHTREAAAFALMRRGADWNGEAADGSFAEEAGALAFALTDESPAARAYAAVGIGKIGAETYAADIEAALSDEDGRTRIAAAYAAALLGMTELAEETMRAELNAPDLPTQTAALTAFPTAAPDGLESLIGLMEGASPALLYHAVGAAVGFERGPEALRLAADFNDAEIQQAALLALSTSAKEAQLYPLIERAPDESAPGLQLEIVAGAGWTYFSYAKAEIPLSDAVVIYMGPENGSGRTDLRGQLTLENLPQGVYFMRVEADGYLPIEAPIALYKGAARIRLHRHY